MNDKEKLKALLTEFGVVFEEKDNNIVCRDGAEKVGGYLGFFTEFEFDAEGKFISIGAWE